MGLMCKYSCEECEMLVYNETACQSVSLKQGTILDNMEAVLNAELPAESVSVFSSKFVNVFILINI